MFDEIICIGTSFTEGAGLNPYHANGDDPDTLISEPDPMVLWYEKNHNIKISSMNEYAYPAQLEHLTGIKSRNLGKSGSSIEYLMRNVEEILEKEDCKDKLFILEYSSWGRSELWFSEINDWIVANWGPKNGTDNSDGYSVILTTDYNFGYQLNRNTHFKVYENFLNHYFNETEFLIQRDRHFLNLLYKLSSKNIKYQVILLENPYWLELSKNSLFNYRDVLNEDFWGYTDSMKLNIKWESGGEINDGHPSIKGHTHIANLIWDSIKIKYNG